LADNRESVSRTLSVGINIATGNVMGLANDALIGLISLSEAKRKDKVLRKFSKFLAQTAVLTKHGSHEELNKYLEDNISEEWCFQNIHSFARTFYENEDESATPYLAVLLSSLLTEMRLPSTNERKLLRLLGRSYREGIEALAHMVKNMSVHWRRGQAACRIAINEEPVGHKIYMSTLPDAYSGEVDQVFRRKPITCSARCRSLVPADADHPSERSDAGIHVMPFRLL